MSRLAAVLILMWLPLLAACAPQAKPAAPSAFPTNPLERPVQPRPLAEDPSLPDRSCRRDADCTVKDVGNCCGYYPACVNVNARTDPKAVQARCAKSGTASVCGFPVINGCSCVKGQCTADTRAVAR